MEMISDFIDRAVRYRSDSQKLDKIRKEVHGLLEKFPLYPEFNEKE